MATQQQLIDEAVTTAQAVQAEWGLEANTAVLWGLTKAIYRIVTGGDPPRIISGYRSPQKTRELLRLWERGDPRVAFKPARRSWHLAGRAIDLKTADPLVDHIWTLLGGRAGTTFGDYNHLDLPGPERPPAAY